MEIFKFKIVYILNKMVIIENVKSKKIAEGKKSAK